MSDFVFLYSVCACVLFLCCLLLYLFFSKDRERKGMELGGVKGSREDL